MARKVNPVARLLTIYDSLNETEQAIAFDLLRSKQPRKAAGKSGKSRQSKSARPAGEKSARKSRRSTLEVNTEEPRESAMSVSSEGDGSEDVS